MILVVGKTGQLARAFQSLIGDKAIYLSRTEMDLSHPMAINAYLRGHKATAVINTAAYTAVDQAEDERDLAFTVNGEAPAAMAAYCAEAGIPLVHYSTDYVFNGQGTAPWREDDRTAPINTYGASKLKGELEVEKVGGDYLILRTSWVYATEGKNFVNTMLKLGAEREELSVVDDQVGAPTYAVSLARMTLDMLDRAAEMEKFPSGIYHVCNQGETSWYGFAKEIFDQARELGAELKLRQLKAVSSAEFVTKAKRPHNSRLSMDKLKSVFGLEMPQWQDDLRENLKEKFK